MDNQPKEIVIKIRTRDIKKLIYFSILLILAILIVLQYFFPISCPKCNCENKTEIKEETTLTQVIPEPIKPLEQEVKEEPKVEENKTETIVLNKTQETEEDEPTIAITGDLYFTLDDIIYDIKGEDWAKVTKIEFTISNAQSIDFTPKILVYCYDDNDPTEQKNYIEEEIILPKLKSSHEITETKDVSISFNEIEKEKTLKLVLKDQDDDVLDTIQKKFTVSS